MLAPWAKKLCGKRDTNDRWDREKTRNSVKNKSNFLLGNNAALTKQSSSLQSITIGHCKVTKNKTEIVGRKSGRKIPIT
jgi:hypothetical protein